MVAFGALAGAVADLLDAGRADGGDSGRAQDDTRSPLDFEAINKGRLGLSTPASPPELSFADQYPELFTGLSAAISPTAFIANALAKQLTGKSLQENLFGPPDVTGDMESDVFSGTELSSPSTSFGGYEGDNLFEILNQSSGTPDQQNQFLNQLRSGFNTQIDEAFQGNDFAPTFDDDIINAILDERQGVATQPVENAFARGNLSPQGHKTARTDISNQRSGAQETLQGFTEPLLGTYGEGVSDIENRARSAANSYNFGDTLFDLAPFTAERDQYVADKQGSLGDEVRGLVGSTPLFDPTNAIQSAGRSQGVVSGKNLFDVFADRQGAGAVTKTDRGIGSSGSGAF